MSSSSRGHLPQLAPAWWVTAGGGGALTTPGSAAAFEWLAARHLPAPSTRWHVAIGLDHRDQPATANFDETTDSRFHIEIYSEEWGFFFCHARRASWIRVTDIAFVHMRDDYALLASTPSLAQIGTLLRAVEEQHHVQFKREHAYINTSLVNAEPAIRAWVQTL